MGNLNNAQDNKLGWILDDLIVPVTIFCRFSPIDETLWTAVFQLMMSAEAAVCGEVRTRAMTYQKACVWTVLQENAMHYSGGDEHCGIMVVCGIVEPCL
jgi:hypothetical protein